MIEWIKKIRERCWICLRRNADIAKKLSDRELAIYSAEQQIRLQQQVIDQYGVFIKEKELLFQKKDAHILDTKKFLVEREMALDIREKSIADEKERLLDSDSIEIKRKILLPSLQEKWKAEAAKLDYERTKILQETPQVRDSLQLRIGELEQAVSIIKTKPKSTGNSDLLISTTSRLDELKKVVERIDKVRSENA